jgi:hypothetical protein
VLTGKGYYIWIVRQCENGDPDRIAALAREANLTHVLVKIADGAFPYNVDLETGYDYARPVIEKLHAYNIEAWGWQYVYGDYPDHEAEIAVSRAIELGVDGYVVNAEGEYKSGNKAPAAARYMNTLRNNLGGMPLALSSYRYPNYHIDFPWQPFLDRVDYNMPQVYWLKSHGNAGAQLQRSVNEFQNIRPFRPIIPTGPTFKQDGWIPTHAEMIEFMQVALNLGLSAVNFWNWDSCRKYMPDFWELVKDFPYGDTPVSRSMPERYIEALNTGNPHEVLQLYSDQAVHIRPEKAIQGKEAIRIWIASLLNNLASDTDFTLVGSSMKDNVYHFKWQVSGAEGGLLNGRDTIGLLDDRISYHYSFIEEPA